MLETKPASALAQALRDARARTLAYVADLRDEHYDVPRLDIVNPPLWELGHVGYFAEFWTLRHLHKRAPIIPQADGLYDSAKIPHDDRWTLPLPSRERTFAFLARQLEETLERLPSSDISAASSYLHRLALHHEDMHGEAFVYTRQTLGYPRPAISYRGLPRAGGLDGDCMIPAGTYRIGARPDDGFVFDNEKWEHDVTLAPYAIARAPVTNDAFAAFVNAGGYERRAYWSDEGWAWREREGALHPKYWRQGENRWERLHFDRWTEVQPNEPVVHVNHYEAQAYCAFANRRLPTEAEWEVAATGGTRRRYPWGEALPAPDLCNLDAWYGDVVDVAAFENGESPFGARQMIGNVWEWTSSAFGPYPGFAPDPYREYSEPWFGNHYVLRGGAWTTRGRLVSTRWRNFYRPQRRDIITGFRTCAREPKGRTIT
ncbi:MAG: selenoneine synthase SenA [Vulcanimicrobiaceae bacterium]